MFSKYFILMFPETIIFFDTVRLKTDEDNNKLMCLLSVVFSFRLL